MEPFIGQIQLFAFGFQPKYWYLCDGSLLQISTNTSLFSLIGTTFGGNGIDNFRLPDLTNASVTPLNQQDFMRYYIAGDGLYPTRS